VRSLTCIFKIFVMSFMSSSIIPIIAYKISYHKYISYINIYPIQEVVAVVVLSRIK